jgi:hypothetical protein
MAFDKLDCHRIGHREPQPATIVFAKHRSPSVRRKKLERIREDPMVVA